MSALRTFVRASHKFGAHRYVNATARELLPPWAPLVVLAAVLLMRTVAC